MKKYIAAACLALAGYHSGAQCTVGVAALTGSGGCSGTTYAYSTVQSFQPTCSGPLKNVAAPNISVYSDDLRGSGYAVVARIRSATGSLLATSSTVTDQWYPGATVTFDFSCANLALTSGTTYQLEFFQTTNPALPTPNPATYQLILFCRSAASVYAGGNYIQDGTAYPAYDIYGWSVSLVNGSIAAASSSATQTLTASSCNVFYNGSNEAIAKVQATGAAMGSTMAKVFVQATAPTYIGQPYVRRYYDITPATNASTATTTTTLYYTQADFDNYNTNRSGYPALPTGPADASGISNLRITQQHGTSATGAPGSFTGWAGSGPANVTITPSGVTYNSILSRWEVTLPVTGFSGFFAYGSAGNPLPLRLVSFTAKADGNRNRIDWQTGVEDVSVGFNIERSADGIKFNTLSEVKGDGAYGTYRTYDAAPMPGANYYRLRVTDAGGQATYSNIALVRSEGYQDGITIAPVPAHNAVTITNIPYALTGSLAVVYNMGGHLIARLTLNANTTIEVGNWLSGVYVVKFSDGTFGRIIKQ